MGNLEYTLNFNCGQQRCLLSIITVIFILHPHLVYCNTFLIINIIKLKKVLVFNCRKWSTFIIAFTMCDWLLTLYILQPLEAAKSLPQRLMYPIMYPYYVLIVESPLSHNRSCFFMVVWSRCIAFLR